MKCPSCGYFNVPNATTCGLCRRSLTDEAEISAEDIMPPRARNRSARQKLEANLSPSTRRHLLSAEGASRQTALPGDRIARGASQRTRGTWLNQAVQTSLDTGNLRFLVKWWLPPLLSIIPGLGQLLQRRYIWSLCFFSGFVLLLFLWLATLHQSVSDQLLWLLGALSVASIFDAARISFPETAPKARALRQVRLALLSFSLVASLATSIFWFLTSFYNIVQLPGMENINSPRFLPGDNLLLTASAPGNFRRGDIVGLNTTETDQWGRIEFNENIDSWQYTTVACIGALPGDTIAACGTSVCVNGSPLPARWLPAHWNVALSLPFQVPADNVWVLRLAGANVTNRRADLGYGMSQSADARLIDTSIIEGRALAIINPPPRRQWLR